MQSHENDRFHSQADKIHFHKNVFTLVLGLTMRGLELRNGLFP